MKQKLLTYFTNVLLETSKLSSCASKQVGALLVRDNRILAISYNGTATGKKHCNDIFKEVTIKNREEHHLWSIRNELHAEQNLIAFCAKTNICTSGSALFVMESPCISCAKLIVASGITTVFYINKYDKDTTGIEFLKECGLEVKQIG